MWQLLWLVLGVSSASKESLEREVKEGAEVIPIDRYRKAAKKGQDAEYDRIEKERAPEQKKIAEKVERKEPGKSAIQNVGNMIKNAFDMTAGYGIAKYQNWRSARELKKDPTKKVVHSMHGFAQNEGNGWRYARELRKQGFVPHLVRGKHGSSDKDNLKQAYGQMDRFYKKAGVKDASKRDDVFDGHSSGGDTGIYMAGDSKVRENGIGTIYARAPAPGGIKPVTFGQRALLPFATKDNLKLKKGKERAKELYKRKPNIPVHVVAGEYDRLVRPEDTLYRHASSHTVMKGTNTTHFGTSGSNKKSNQQMAAHLKELTRKPRVSYQPGVTGREAYQKAA